MPRQLPPRCILIHDHPQAQAALAVATELGVAVKLRSAEGAVGYLGPAYFRGLDVVLDCGEAPGHALAALRAGVKRIRLRATPETLARIADIARQLGSELDQTEAPTLDLASVPMGRWSAACHAWLTSAP